MADSRKKATGVVTVEQNQLELYQPADILQFQIPTNAKMKGMTLYVTGVPMHAVKNREPFAVVLVREALVLCPLMGQEDFYAISLLDIQDVKTVNLTKVTVKVPSSLGSIPATIPYATAVEVTYTIPRQYGGLTHGLKWAVSESESAETWVDAILLAIHEYKVG